MSGRRRRIEGYLRIRLALNSTKRVLVRVPGFVRAYKRAEARFLGDQILAVSCKGGFVVHILARDEAVGRELLSAGEWEPYASELVKELLPSGGTFVDVGANLGYFTALAARVAGLDGRVVSIEPDPQNVELIRRTCSANGLSNVFIVDQAVGEKEGSAQLSLDPRNLGNHSLIHENVPESSGVKQITVPVITLAEVLRISGVGHADVMKMDVQGYEAKALSSVDLRQCADYLLLEFWPTGLSQAGSDYELFASELFLAGAVFLVDGQGTRISDPESLVAAATQADSGQVDILVKVGAPPGISSWE